jgi:hypothetical protein
MPVKTGRGERADSILLEMLNGRQLVKVKLGNDLFYALLYLLCK